MDALARDQPVLRLEEDGSLHRARASVGRACTDGKLGRDDRLIVIGANTTPMFKRLAEAMGMVRMDMDAAVLDAIGPGDEGLKEVLREVGLLDAARRSPRRSRSASRCTCRTTASRAPARRARKTRAGCSTTTARSSS